MTNVTSFPHTDPALQPPHNFDLEMALLGALLSNNDAYEQVSEFLKPEHFADDRHGTIYRWISERIEQGRVADPITLSNAAAESPDMGDIGGSKYVARLAVSAVSISSASDYARSLVELATRRALLHYTADLTVMARDYDMDVPEVVERANSTLERLTGATIIGTGLTAIRDVVHRTMEALDARRKHDGTLIGLPTGLADLDELLCGLQKKHLIILGGRPGMAKSTLARHIAFNVAKGGVGVAVFSLEMTAEEWTTQQLADSASVNMQQLRRGNWVNDQDFARVVEASSSIQGLPLFIEDDPGLTIQQMKIRTRKLMRRQNIGLIVVDHLQITRPEKAENRTQELTQITQDSKRLAKTLDVPVLALCQLNRGLEQRDDKRPILADLRQSGSIEEDADEVIFIYRDRYYNREEPKKQSREDEVDYYRRVSEWINSENTAELIVAKQRMGPIDTVKVYYDGKHSRFRDLAPAGQEDMDL